MNPQMPLWIWTQDPQGKCSPKTKELFLWFMWIQSTSEKSLKRNKITVHKFLYPEEEWLKTEIHLEIPNQTIVNQQSNYGSVGTYSRVQTNTGFSKKKDTM